MSAKPHNGLLSFQEGATALVVCGTSGEAPTFSPSPTEHRMLIRIAVGVSRGQIPVIAGAGSNSTDHAVELTRDAEAHGADAILSVVPYYNRPTQTACTPISGPLLNRQVAPSLRLSHHPFHGSDTCKKSTIGLQNCSYFSTNSEPSSS
jgi:hypothetical protein